MDRYFFLDRTKYSVYHENRIRLSKQTLQEMADFEVIEIYPKEKIEKISKQGLIQQEINRLVEQIIELQEKSPEGSNAECIAMDCLVEFMGKLHLDDFRKIKIAGLIEDNQASK